MIHFSSAEQRARTDAFDSFVYYTDDVLRDPQIVAEIGDTAMRLREINSRLFLPNYRNGQFTLPWRQRNTDHTPLVPLSDDEADEAYGLIEPLQQKYVRAWQADEAVESKRYGLFLPDELEAVFTPKIPNDDIQSGSEDTNKPTVRGLKKDASARAQAMLGRTDDFEYYRSTRPVIMARRSIVRQGSLAMAAALAHEQVHVEDLLDEGPLYATQLYGAASELRAYHVSASIYCLANIYIPGSDASIWIDSLRRVKVGDNAYPYTPTADLVTRMVEAGLVD